MRTSSPLLIAFVASFALASSHVECDSADARPSLLGLDLRLLHVEADTDALRVHDATGREIGILVDIQHGPQADVLDVLLTGVGAVARIQPSGEIDPIGLIHFDEPGCEGSAYVTVSFNRMPNHGGRAFVAVREPFTEDVVVFSRLSFNGCTETDEGGLLARAARLREVSTAEIGFDPAQPLPTPLFVGWDE